MRFFFSFDLTVLSLVFLDDPRGWYRLEACHECWTLSERENVNTLFINEVCGSGCM